MTFSNMTEMTEILHHSLKKKRLSKKTPQILTVRRRNARHLHIFEPRKKSVVTFHEILVAFSGNGL